MGQSSGLADQKTRERVLTPDQSFIVQAPAGSGKTELLVRRYLRLLAVADAPEEIIALTFTRKAAAEMRGRIIAALQAAQETDVNDKNDFDDNAQARKRLAVQALVRDEELGWQLTKNPARMRIQTIDSFCAGLTGQMPVLSKLGGQPAVIEDSTDLYGAAAADTLKQLEDGISDDGGQPGGASGRSSGWSDAIETLLIHLDNDLPRVRDMLATMLRKRDQWLRHLVGQRPDRGVLESALKRVAEAALDEMLQALPPDSLAEFADCLRFATENLPESPYLIEELPGNAAGDLEQWQFIAELCLTNTGSWRQSLTARQGFPPNNTGKHMKQRFRSVLSQLADDDRLSELFPEIRNLPPVSYTEEEWEALQALYELLMLANARLYLLFAERNEVDFTGISLAALQSLGAEDNPTDLALYLDYRIRHILVDEYQDISINQYELLEKLTAGWSPEDGHSLFLVGDPMQSIYRFRDAEVGLFLNTWQQQRLGQVAVETVNIEVNFRSDKALVDWVNRAFSEALPGESDAARGAVNFTPAVAFHDHEGGNGVCVHPMFGRDDALEAKLVVEQIKTIRDQSGSENIAVLASNRAHLQSITALLNQAGLRFRAVEIKQLGTRPAIQDLMALTRALHHPADRVAWLAILRAPWCGLSLADLLALTADARNDTIWHCLQDKERWQTLSTAGRKRLDKLCGVLEQAFMRQGRTPLRRWVEGVWLNLGGPATLDTPTDLHNADTFFDLLDDFDTGGDLRNRDEFIDRVNALYASADVRADVSLQVMTIHKAKGLEFDHVILPGLSRGGRGDDPQLLLWSESPYQSRHVTGQVGHDLLLAPVKESSEDSSPIYDFIKKLEKRKQRHEEGRLLYVATTRARKQLHLFASVKINQDDTLAKPSVNTLLAQLWPVVGEDYQAAFENQAGTDEQGPSGEDILPAPTMTAPSALKRLPTDWPLSKPPPAAQWHDATQTASSVDEDTGDEDLKIEYQWAGRAIMHIGTVVHHCIQTITTEGIEQWNTEKISARRQYYQESLLNLGVYEEQLDRACGWVEQALAGILTDPRGQWLLGNHREQASEYALSGIHQGKVANVIIDRTFVDEENIRWIVDYKTSRHDSGDVKQFLDLQQERYRGQLEKYAVIMSGLEDRPIRLGLYFPLLRGWREWAYSP